MKRGILVLGVVVLVGALAWSAARGRSAKRPNVLFVSVDTLRADHLGTYGWKRPTSPNVDAFAAKGVVFERAQSSSSWTLPSLTTLMTSLLPSTHRCEKDSSRLDPSYTTLAEILRDAGYDTAIVASHLFLNAGHGLQQGFTRVDTRIIQDDFAITSPQVTDWGISWLEDKAAAKEGTPWFLWLHYFDPHAPYLPHEGISEPFGTDKKLDLYDGEIAFTDLHLGRLFEAFERLGFAENTIVVFVADHGEEFGEHGQEGHGYDLHEEVVHVPLVLRAPGIAPRRVPDLVPTVDVLPTLLDLCGVKSKGDIEGRTLLPLMRGEKEEPREACSENKWMYRFDIASLSRGTWKYIDSKRREDVSEMLFDHAADPAEKTNVLREHPDVAAELRAGLRARQERAKALGAGYERHPTSDLPPSEQDRLRALGYAGEESK